MFLNGEYHATISQIKSKLGNKMDNNSAVLLNIDHRENPCVAIITLNRPKQGNALDTQTLNDLLNKLDEAEANPIIRILLLKGEGKHFCAGADLHEMYALTQGSYEENHSQAKLLASVFNRLAHSRLIIISLAHGSIMGGGLGLLACSDFVLASDDARFCFSEVKLGLIPATIAPYVLRRIGFQSSRRLMLSAELFNVTQAEQLKLVDAVTSKDQLNSESTRIMNHLLQHGTQALTQTKILLNQLMPVDTHIQDLTAKQLADIRQNPEAKNRLASFIHTSTRKGSASS